MNNLTKNVCAATVHRGGSQCQKLYFATRYRMQNIVYTRLLIFLFCEGPGSRLRFTVTLTWEEHNVKHFPSLRVKKQKPDIVLLWWKNPTYLFATPYVEASSHLRLALRWQCKKNQQNVLKTVYYIINYYVPQSLK